MADEQHPQTDPLKNQIPAEDQAVSEAAPPPASKPPSQVEMDIKEAGLTPEEAVQASRTAAAKNGRKTGRGGAENLAEVSRFRWLLLLALSLAATLTWAVEAQYSGRPYHWPAWGLFLAAALAALPAARFLRLPTRAGLAALFWSSTFFISALYGPQDAFFRIPAALPWAGLLTLAVFFAAVAVWRKVGRYKVIDVALAAILIYAALSPLWSLIDNLIAGGALALKLEILSASPAFLTERLPWYLWPMTIMVLGVLPLAALFALWDQGAALRRKGGRHGGNFFLALAFLGLMPYGFLAFDQAVTAKPAWAQALRAILPSASVYARQGGVAWSAPEGGPPIPSGPPEQLAAVPEAQPPADGEASASPDAAPAPDEETEAAPAEPEAGSDSATVSTLNARLRAAERELAEARDQIEALERRLDQLTATPSPAPPPSPAPGSKPEAAPEPIPNPPPQGEGSPYSSTGTEQPSPSLPILKT